MSSTPKGHFAAYKNALNALSARTRTPLPSLILSFGILHEITAVVPLVAVFYGSRTLGIGEGVISTIVPERSPNSTATDNWVQGVLRTWVEEGDAWAGRIGRRYGVFGYEKRIPGAPEDHAKHSQLPIHIAGDVANAIVAYGVTKVKHFCLFELESPSTFLPHSLDKSLSPSAELSYAHSIAEIHDVICLLFAHVAQSTLMPKLHLKRTPEEEAAHQLRKKQRREVKAKRNHGLKASGEPSRKRSRHRDTTPERPWASSDDEPHAENYRESGPSSSSYHASSSVKPDYEKIRAELDEQRFREKMASAFDDDERLDSLEARFNDFSHIPGRWRADGSKTAKPVYDDAPDEFLKMDPRYMDDEEYAEWVRIGMYRKTHADEYAEQQRKKAMKAQRREEEKARRIETKRLDRLAEAERLQKKLEREDRRRHYAREEYEIRWKALLSGRGDDDDDATPPRELRFHDIPWPIFAAHRQKSDKRGSTSSVISVSLEQLTHGAMVEFLIPSTKSSSDDPTQREAEKRERKDKLRETFLRFHPDKFEGRFMKLVRENEREAVREAIGQVVRSLNTLMSDNS
ncbi:hypothetical protein DXG03_001446 [Asterophora parasitica]|uniref:Uncharacterized protein n=1 Tax=Asterophora parasitica TaxID=117018 RepID=A0A9P7GBZ7_9AGAR|nr:hypothetical protein DXG03_001446 [Asterophora parasitica]